jgi:hypothetical protein
MKLYPLIPAAIALLAQTAPQPQPVAFSHRVHAGTLKLPCKTCHAQPEADGPMTLPQDTHCLNCHKEETPALAKLFAAVREKEPLAWQRVYELPSYVFWNHAPHLASGATCEKCHGPVAARDVLTREISHRMADCIACHRTNQAGTDCSFCHEPRN